MFANVWFEHRDHIIFHDPLAGAILFDDHICRFEKGTVQVELMSEKLRGMTFWTSEKKLPVIAQPRHEIALEVDPERFFNHYFSFFLT